MNLFDDIIKYHQIKIIKYHQIKVIKYHQIKVENITPKEKIYTNDSSTRMSRFMSNKKTDKRSNNTSSQRGDTSFGTLANNNKFAILSGERPKEEVSSTKKMDKNKTQEWKTVSTKKYQKKSDDTVKNETVISDIDVVDKCIAENVQQEQQKEFRPFKKFIDPAREFREYKKTDDECANEEQKKLYIETFDNTNELGNNMFLNSPWTVWIHKADCQVWTEESYTNIYVVNSIGSFWRFFNNFHALDKVRNQFFIMRNKIKPIWEDNDNRNGGICSIKLDCFSRQGRIDIGVEIMMCVCLLVMNETLVQANEEINGISYSIKNRSVLIKLWCKNFNNKISEKLPIGLFSKLDTMMRNMDRDRGYGRKPPTDNKLSIRYTQIKPEYEMELMYRLLQNDRYKNHLLFYHQIKYVLINHYIILDNIHIHNYFDMMMVYKICLSYHNI